MITNYSKQIFKKKKLQSGLISLTLPPPITKLILTSSGNALNRLP